MMDIAHIHPEFRHVLSMSDDDRMAFLDKPHWIGYALANHILDNLRGLMEKPVRPRTPNLLIVGDSNNGKTTIVRRFQKLHGEGYVNENVEPVKPVIVSKTPPSADEKGLYIAILECFWTPHRATDPVPKLRHQVIHLMRYCHVRILIIDEFHALLTGTMTKQREVMNAIKLLRKELAIPIVAVGTRDAVRVLHTDPQHASRFDVVTLPPWELNPEFQQLVASFERVLPLKKPSLLDQSETVSLLFAISEGNLGNLHRILVECAVEAIKTGAEKIDKSVIDGKQWLRPTRG